MFTAPTPIPSPFLTTAALSLLALLAATPTAAAFRFNATTPTQCGDWTVTWDGGSAPFFLVLVPTITVSGGRIMNISMPAQGQPPYSHTFTLPEPAGLDMVATMYDTDGFGSGGATNILSVASSSDSSCINKTVNADFFFSTTPTSNPQQCGDMAITWNSDAVDPVGLYGIVPGGTAWTIPISAAQMDSRSLDWTVDIATGTEFILLMSDAGVYGTGGSVVNTVTGSSGSSSNCINASSPSTTPVVPWTATSGSSSSTAEASKAVSHVSSLSAGASSTTGTAAADHGGAKKSNTGAIIGAVIGVLAAAILALLAFCLCRRRRQRHHRDLYKSELGGSGGGVAHGSGKEASSASLEMGVSPAGGHARNLASAPPVLAPTATASATGSGNERQGLLDRLIPSSVSSIGHSRNHSRNHSRVPSGSVSDTLDSARRDRSAVAGQPHGAPAPSVFTQEHLSEVYHVNPYPFADTTGTAPPPFSASRASVSSMDKSGAGAGSGDDAPVVADDPADPFSDVHRGVPDRAGTNTPLSPVGGDETDAEVAMAAAMSDADAHRRKAALGMGGVTRPGSRVPSGNGPARAGTTRASDLLTLSEFPHLYGALSGGNSSREAVNAAATTNGGSATRPSEESGSGGGGGLVVDRDRNSVHSVHSVHSAEHWHAMTIDPPPQYNPYDRLRAANPDEDEDEDEYGTSARTSRRRRF